MNKTTIYFLILTVLITTNVNAGLSCFKSEQINNPDLKKVERVYTLLLKSTQSERDNLFECSDEKSVYKLEENILKSNFLSDTQKLEYFYKIGKLFSNNAEMSEVLAYEIIKLIIIHKKQPLKKSVEMIKDLKLRKHVLESLIDADLL